MDAFNPITTRVRLGNPINADLFTTTREVSFEKKAPEAGDTMAAELGPAFAQHYVVGVSESPDRGKKGISITHFKNTSIENQHTRNFQITGDDVLVRTYVILRTEYPSALPPIAVADPDSLFPRYGFSHEQVVNSDWGLDSVFVTVQRFYQQIIKTRQFYDDDLDCDVSQTTRIIAKGSGTASSVAGETVEVQPVNTFYDLEITSTAAGEYPRQMKTLLTDVRYPFPALLRGVTLEYVWALANNQNNPYAYKEDWLFDYDLVEPTGGPYDAQILRFLTADPDQYRDDYPIQKIVTVRETIGIAKAWYNASDAGNTAFADIQQLEVPPSIHGDIDIGNADTVSVGQNKNSLPATPGYAAFAASALLTIGYEPVKTRYGLYEVRITQINSSGIYNANSAPIGTPGATTGADEPVAGRVLPEIASTAINASNTVLSGTATPLAEITATLGLVRYGLTTADAQGVFTMALSPVLTDSFDLSVKARKNGKTSLTHLVRTNDLTPAAPTGSISSDLTTLAGMSEPNAKISIIVSAVQQVETATVSGTIDYAGDALVEVTSSIVAGSPLSIFFPVLLADSAAAVAGKARTALSANTAITSKFTVSGTGANIILTAITAAPNDSTFNIATRNSSCDGLDDVATSTDTVPGRTPITETADGTGAYSHTFAPPLVGGDTITITASDGGGTSAPTLITASSTPPTLTSAAFSAPPAYDTIQGVASLGSIVVAYLGDAVVGSDLTDGTGHFGMTLNRSYISGETLRVIAYDPASETPSGSGIYTIASAAVIVTAANLELAAPVFKKSSFGYYGTAPTGALQVVVTDPNGDETLFAVFASMEFLFTIPANNYMNGENYEIRFRYAVGDSSPVYISFPKVPLPGVTFLMASPGWSDWSTDTITVNGLTYTDYTGYAPIIDTGWADAIKSVNPSATPSVTRYIPHLNIPGKILTISTPNVNMPLLVIKNPNVAPGTTIRMTFPGQALPPIEVPAQAAHFLGNLIYFPFARTPPSNPIYTQTGPLPTKAQLVALLPLLMVVTVTAPDGRQSTTTFDLGLTRPFGRPAQ